MLSSRRLTLSKLPIRAGQAVLVGAVGLLVAIAWLSPGSGQSAIDCPNSNPVVNENQCLTGTSAWRVNAYSPNLGGYTTQTSVDLGENVVLKVGRNAPVSSNATVEIGIYRMGYYKGAGGRLIDSATVPINNDFGCEAMDAATGLVSCANWAPSYTIPGGVFPDSGVYMAKLKASTGEETQTVFVVRDDSRKPTARFLYVLPTATYEAYNTFGGKSLYFGLKGGTTVASGTDRAVKVSFDRPLSQEGNQQNSFLGPDFDLLQWMERQGYEISYTDDVQLQKDPGELLDHDIAVISGHSEYWSLGQFNAFLAARDAGINIASFSANTAYWKVRYENGDRTLVCYKTVQGAGSGGSGSVSQNDWGPDGIKGTADDALGLDQKAGTADDRPQNSTTTFRDNGAPPGDPNAPAGGRVGPDMPENQLFGIMYVGDNDSRGFPVTVPPANAKGEFAGDPFWRNTGVYETATTNIGTLLVNWEWDAIPTQAQYLSHEPAGVIRLFETNVQTASDNSWIQDEGRNRNTSPPPGQPGTVGAVRYTAPSGALVFASGTMQWARGLTTESDSRIQLATANLFAEMGARPMVPGEESGSRNAAGNAAGGGSGGGSGSGVSAAKLRSLVRPGLATRATAKGEKILVRAGCPAAAQRPCSISVTGLLKKGKPATSTVTLTVRPGGAKRFGLIVKPALAARVAIRKRLLIRQTVAVADARTTLFKSLELLRP